MRAADSTAESAEELVQLPMPCQPADWTSGIVMPKQQQPARSPAARLAHSGGNGSRSAGQRARAAGRPAGAPALGGRARANSVPSEQNHQLVAAAAGMRQRFSAALRDVLDEDLVCEASLAALEERLSNKRNGRFRGVTRHKRTQRYEAHIWRDKKQIYLGGFQSELAAAKSHDIMALKCKQNSAGEALNFGADEYASLQPLLSSIAPDDVIAALRMYSKAQPVLQLQPAASAHRTSRGRVEKPNRAAGRAGPERRQRSLQSPAGKLSINTASTVQRVATSPTAGGTSAKSGSPISPRPPPGTPRAAFLQLLHKQRQRAAASSKSCSGSDTHGCETDSESKEEDGARHMGRSIGSCDRAAGEARQEGSHGRGKEEPLLSRDLSSTQCSPLEEPSLTLSFSEESRLFEWLPVGSGQSGLEHTLNGTVLLRSPQQQQDYLGERAALVRGLEPHMSAVLPAGQLSLYNRVCKRGMDGSLNVN
ncbi:hypothetical protein N2152v2_004454 [Parachlorella kessleri]